MKPIFSFCLIVVAVTLMASAVARAQSQTTPPSLGDYARAVKKAPKTPTAAAKVYDNDNLPKNSSLSVVGATGETDHNAAAQDRDKSADGKTADDKSKAEKTPEIKPGQSIDERQKALAAWQSRLDEQRKSVELLSRELDVLKREHDIKATEFYSNTTIRAQNPTAFAATDEKYKQQIADKQAALDAAKTKLDDLQDQARKSGAPSSVTE